MAAEGVGYSADPSLAVTVCLLALRYATQPPEWGVRSVHIAFLPAPLSGSRERKRGIALRAVGRYPSYSTVSLVSVWRGRSTPVCRRRSHPNQENSAEKLR